MEEIEKKETMELEKIKPTKATLMIRGREREFKFGFSAWAKIEEEYDGLDNLEKLEEEVDKRPFHIIPHLMYLALQDKEGVTEENVLDDYGLQDLPLITEVFKKAFYGSLPIDEMEDSGEKKTETIS